MEKYTQFRDRGTGVAPFMPIVTPRSWLATIPGFILFSIRVPFFIVLSLNYFVICQLLWLPLLGHKLLRWTLLIVAGIFFVDIQVDGVKRGALSSQPKSRVPHPRSIVASNFTSPIDALYLSAIFDPIFVKAFPNTRKVEVINVFQACLLAARQVELAPSNSKRCTTFTKLLENHPDRIIAVFPECAATNGRGLLPLSQSLLAVPPSVDIFPVSIRYTPPDITTPVPGSWYQFLWRLLSRPTTCLRVRLADAVYNKPYKTTESSLNPSDDEWYSESESSLTQDEKKILDNIADTLARLGRNKRVGLTLKDKAAFTKAWYGS